MENKARYTLVGFFIFIFTVAMVGFILWLARYDVKEMNAKEFRVYSKTSIAGLHKNSIVEYKGLDVGSVKDIRIDPKNLEQIEIILKITNPQIVKTNSFATIQSLGVTGNKIIEIDGGTVEAKELISKDNTYSVLPLKKSFFDTITTKAGDIGSQIEVVLKRFEELLNKENIENFNKILNNSNKSTENFNEMLLKINTLLDDGVEKTINNLNTTTQSINKVVQDDLKQSLQRFNTLSSDMSNLSLEVQDIINKDVKILLENLNKTATSTQNIDKVIYQLDNTLEKIDTTMDNFEQNGGDMIFKTREVTYGPGEKQ